VKSGCGKHRSHIAELRKRAAEAAAKPKRLYDSIENGIADVSDPMLKERAMVDEDGHYSFAIPL
jgi:site-specific DNA recombinase